MNDDFRVLEGALRGTYAVGASHDEFESRVARMTPGERGGLLAFLSRLPATDDYELRRLRGDLRKTILEYRLELDDETLPPVVGAAFRPQNGLSAVAQYVDAYRGDGAPSVSAVIDRILDEVSPAGGVHAFEFAALSSKVDRDDEVITATDDLGLHDLAEDFREMRLLGLRDRIARREDNERARNDPWNERTLASVRRTLEEALDRAESLHRGEFAYASDKLFPPALIAGIKRAAVLALRRDEAWAVDLVGRLLVLVGTAPTPAKTAPSQAATIALGQAIEEAPSPESVQALRAGRSALRHAGLEKKLARNVASATKKMSLRPEIALRIAPDAKVTASQKTVFLAAAQATYLLSTCWSATEWSQVFFENKTVAELSRRLIWITDGGVTGMGRPGEFLDVTGQPVEVAGDVTIRLWHPLHGDDGARQAWRNRLWSGEVTQPFRQAYREWYVVDASLGDAGNKITVFGGHLVDWMRFLGAARAEGWSLIYEGITRSFGPVTVIVETDRNLYPGIQGEGYTGGLRLVTTAEFGATSRPLRVSDVPPVTVSEILRAVDLLVSIAGLGVGDSHDGWSNWKDQPRGIRSTENARTVMRDVLAQIFVALPSVRVGQRHVEVGDYQVHLWTGRVTRGGDPIDIDVTKAKTIPMPFLPYDEKLLTTIVQRVQALVALAGGS
jgi:hypothetical protein